MQNTTQAKPITEEEAVFGSLLLRRRSCRAFRSTPVPRDTITRILELAQLSPSWCNTQPWEVLISEGEGTERLRSAISAAAAGGPPAPDIPFPARYAGVYKERRLECALQLYDSVGIASGDRAASMAQTQLNFEFFGAPHLAIVTTERDLGTYGAVDCGVFLSAFVLAAESLGVATIPQAAIAVVAPVIREHFDLPENREVLLGISFGYADEQHPANGFRTRRASVDQVVTWVT